MDKTKEIAKNLSKHNEVSMINEFKILNTMT